MNDRIYTVQIDAYPLDACDIYESRDALPEWLHGWEVETVEDIGDAVAVLADGWKPDGWHPPASSTSDEFWWPATGRLYKSRSAARERAHLIESFGARAIILESAVEWLPIREANRRRWRARVDKRISRLEAEIARVKEAETA